MKIGLSALILLLTFTAFSQSGYISGKVTNQLQQPLTGATIALQQSEALVEKKAISDSAGLFRLTEIIPGKYNISVSLTGYVTQTLSVTASDSTITEHLSIVLVPDVKSLEAVSVTGRKKLYEMKADKIVMNVEQNTLAAGNSVFDLLRMAPGVTMSKDDIVQLKGIAVKIFVNDKPFYLSGTQLVEYLKNLPADALSTIEIISNPSSKYDAEGLSGIINLKMKKSSLMGLNGVANIGLGMGKYPKINGGLSLNYRTKKLNIFGSIYPIYSESYNKLDYNSIIVNGGNTIYQNRSNYWHPKSHWLSYSAGADYDISPRSVIGILISGGGSNSKEVTDNNTVFSDGNKIPFQYIISRKNNKISSKNINYNLNYKTDIDSLGSKLSIDFDYANYKRDQSDINENIYLDQARSPFRPAYTFRNTQPASTQLISIKSDFTKYFTKKTYIETGMKYSYVKNDKNLMADSLNGVVWNIDNSRTNHFIYDEGLAAIYLSVNHKFRNTSVQLGLRGENTIGKGHSLTLNQIDDRKYFNLFPTFFVSHNLDKNNTINFSYSYRIGRPSYQSLNPFVMYIDPYTVFEGNPYLRPSFTHSLEIKHGFKQILFTTLSYRHMDGNRITAIYQDPVKLVTINKTQNSGTDDYIGLNLSSSVRVTKWWTTYNNIELSHNIGKSTLPEFSYHTQTYAGSLSNSNTFNLKSGFKVQTSFFYNSPTNVNLQRILSSYGLNIGVQKTFLDQKATVNLNFNNVIGTSAYRTHYLGEGLDIRWRNEWEGRKVNLTVTYKFGNQKVKASRSRNLNSEEKNRINL